jgi:ABC-type uncharacterized transport system involved in gliding motility auxiliary subunit
MVVDLLTRLLGVDPFTAVAVEYSDHEITRDFTTVNLFFPHARPVLVEGGEGTELLRTGKSSWAESDFSSDSIEYNPEKDLAGPLSLAVAEEKTVQGQGPAAAGTGGKTEASAALKKEEERKARLVVFGCSGFATDKWFLNSANGNLFLNAVNWLASEKSLISLAPKTFKPRTVSLTAGQYLSLLLWTVLLLPVAVLVLGLGVWLKRRRL